MLRYTGEVPSWDQARVDQETRVQEVISNTPSEADQLDAIAKMRGWYNPYNTENSTLSNYTTGSLSLQDAIETLAEPIDHLYTSADDGRAFYEEEMVARSQRSFYDAAKAEEMWGVEQDFPESNGIGKPSLESKLWCLWYAVLHTARKISWTDEEKQMKLVDFAKQLKLRPNPPLPQNMTVPLKRSWQYSSGTLWSSLSMLGPSTRETWNDTPGYGAGFSVPEVNGTNNVNAFVARLSVHGVADFLRYGVWALDACLDDIPRTDHRGTSAEKMDVYIPTAVIWIRVAGEAICAKILKEDHDFETRYDSDQTLSPQLPGSPPDQSWTRARWIYYRERFEIMSGRKKLSEQTRRLSAKAVVLMEQIEKDVLAELDKTGVEE